MTLRSRDTFIRANQTGWGTASDGETWQAATSNGTATVSISSNTGVVTGASTGASNYQLLGTTTFTDSEVLAKAQISILSTSGSISLLARDDGSTSNYYRCVLASDFEITKTISGTSTTLGTATFAASLNTYYWMRFRVVSTSLQAKIWQDGNVEPSNWTVSVTDSSLTSGQCGLRGFANSGNTVTFAYFEVNDVNNSSMITDTGMISSSPGGIFS